MTDLADDEPRWLAMDEIPYRGGGVMGRQRSGRLDIEAEREWWEQSMTVEAARRTTECARRKHRQDIADTALAIALAVVMIFLACFTVGGMLMLFGYSWLT